MTGSTLCLDERRKVVLLQYNVFGFEDVDALLRELGLGIAPCHSQDVEKEAFGKVAAGQAVDAVENGRKLLEVSADVEGRCKGVMLTKDAPAAASMSWNQVEVGRRVSYRDSALRAKSWAILTSPRSKAVRARVLRESTSGVSSELSSFSSCKSAASRFWKWAWRAMRWW